MIARLIDWLRSHGVALAVGGSVGITVGWGAWHQHYDVALPETQLIAPADAGIEASP